MMHYYYVLCIYVSSTMCTTIEYYNIEYYVIYLLNTVLLLIRRENLLAIRQDEVTYLCQTHTTHI